MASELRLSVRNNFQLSLATPPESPHNPTELVPLSPLKSNSHQALQLASSTTSRRRFTFEGVENGMGSASYSSCSSSSSASIQDVFVRSHFAGAAAPGTPEKPKIPQLLSTPQRKLLQSSSSSSAAAPGTPEKPKIPQLLPSPQRNPLQSSSSSSAAAPGTPEKPKIPQLLPSPQRNPLQSSSSSSAAAPGTPEKPKIPQLLSSPQRPSLQSSSSSSAAASGTPEKPKIPQLQLSSQRDHLKPHSYSLASHEGGQNCSSTSSSSSSSASALAEPTSLDEVSPSNLQHRADFQTGLKLYRLYTSYIQVGFYEVIRKASWEQNNRIVTRDYSVGFQMPKLGTCIFPCQFLDEKGQTLQLPVMHMLLVSNKYHTPLLERERLLQSGMLPGLKLTIPHNDDLAVIFYTQLFIQSKMRYEVIAKNFHKLLQNIQEGVRLRETFTLTQTIRNDDGLSTIEIRNFPFIPIYNSQTALEEGYIVTKNAASELKLDKDQVFQSIRKLLEMSIDPKTIAEKIFLDLTRSNVKMDPFFNVYILSHQRLGYPVSQDAYVQQMIANLESLAGDDILLWTRLVKNFHQINPGIASAVNQIVSQRAIKYSLDQEAAAMALEDDE